MADERTDKQKVFDEYPPDIRYNLDTDEIIDVKVKKAEQIDSNLSMPFTESVLDILSIRVIIKIWKVNFPFERRSYEKPIGRTA